MAIWIYQIEQCSRETTVNGRFESPVRIPDSPKARNAFREPSIVKRRQQVFQRNKKNTTRKIVNRIASKVVKNTTVFGRNLRIGGLSQTAC